jgi:hypothetical protein
MMNMKNQQQQCHLYAQKLNNRAALCIEIGHYDRAIASLAKALRLSAGNNHSSSDQHQRQHQHQEEEQFRNENRIVNRIDITCSHYVINIHTLLY